MSLVDGNNLYMSVAAPLDDLFEGLDAETTAWLLDWRDEVVEPIAEDVAASHIAAVVATVREDAPVTSISRIRAHRRARTLAKVAVGASASFVAMTGLAAASVLPAPAARTFQIVAEALGVPVPGPIVTSANGASPEPQTAAAPAPVVHTVAAGAALVPGSEAAPADTAPPAVPSATTAPIKPMTPTTVAASPTAPAPSSGTCSTSTPATAPAGASGPSTAATSSGSTTTTSPQAPTAQPATATCTPPATQAPSGDDGPATASGSEPSTTTTTAPPEPSTTTTTAPQQTTTTTAPDGVATVASDPATPPR
jgi:hypothetical protein